MQPQTHAVTVKTWPVPKGAPASGEFTVKVDGKLSGVYADQHHAFTIFSSGGGAVKVQISCKSEPKSVTVRPLSAGIKPMVEGKQIAFELDRPRKLSVEVNKTQYLFLFADPLETDVPEQEDPNVVWFGPGFHDLKKQNITLKSGQTLYLSGGAYLANGRSLIIRDAENVKVRGRGVFVGNTRVYASRHVDIEGIVINPGLRSWMNKIDASQHVRYHNYKALAGNDSVPNFDGFDVMSGCNDIVIEDVFVRATDDCLTVKHHPFSPGYWSSKAPVANITLRNSVLWNLKFGTVFRIGPETIGPLIERVTMQNVDVIHADRGFEILPVDGVWIRHVLLEGIRIEDYRRDLLGFDMRTWYKVGPRRGHVDGVYIRKWDVRGGIRGWKIHGADDKHGFRNVYVDGMKVDGVAIKDDTSEVRGKLDFGASFNASDLVCGGVQKKGFFAHPPFKGTTGQTIGEFALKLPDREKLSLRMSVGLKDGARSDNGVRFAVEVEGKALAEKTVLKADGWKAVSVDLSSFKGRDVKLQLIVDALGNSSFDWAAIGAPRVVSGDETVIDLTAREFSARTRTYRASKKWGSGAIFGRDARPPEDRAPPAITDIAAAVTGADGHATRVYVVFSESLDKASAEQPDNYAIPGIRVEKARLDYHLRQVILNTSPLKGDTEHFLTVKNVKDLAGNAVGNGAKRAVSVRASWKASDGYAAFQGKFGWWYEQFNPENVQVYNNRRDIIRTPRYWLINYYPTPDGEQWLAHREDTGIKQDLMHAGKTFRAVRAWMAPADGRIRVSGAVKSEGEKGHGARIRIVHNQAGSNMPKDDIVLWDWQNVGDGALGHDLSVDVVAGGVVRFILDNGGGDETKAVVWNPAIAFIK